MTPDDHNLQVVRKTAVTDVALCFPLVAADFFGCGMLDNRSLEAVLKTVVEWQVLNGKSQGVPFWKEVY